MAESKRRIFECLGVSLGESSSENVQGDCPFCGKENHFYVNQLTGQWDCKSCIKSGNMFTFLEEISEKAFRETHAKDWYKLTLNRSTSRHVNGGAPVSPHIPAEAFKRWHMGWSGTEWYIPCFSEKGTVRDIRRWSGGRVMSTEGCHLQLGGLQELAIAQKGTTVWVCEGEWDAIALRWLLDLAGYTTDVVVYVPGAGVFKQEWVPFFKGMRVILCYDNDDSGDRGSMKAGHVLKGTAAEILYLCWPEDLPTGWDTRDYVLDGRGRDVTALDAIAVLESICRPKHRRDSTPEKTPLSPASENGEEQPIANYEDVLTTFGKWIKLDKDFRDALAVCLAISLANDVPGDPLWLYLVGPPGSGKTLILCSMQDSDRTKFYSTLSPKSLVSGFNVHPDPSLLPHLDGKTAVFKDGTELLAMHPDARREVYGVLRGAFDGHVYKPFGNGIIREYVLHFNLLIGVTPAIHGDSQATMGERFLKFELKEELADSRLKIKAAVNNIATEIQMQTELSDMVRRFLVRGVDPTQLPKLTEEMIDRVIALAQIIGILRAQVDRESFGDRDIRYRPSYEVGTRVAKQLVKLAMMLTYVFDIMDIDERIYKIIERVAMDTVIGFHLDIMKQIMMRGNQGLTVAEIAKHAKIPTTTTMRRLQDLEQLGVLTKTITPRLSHIPIQGPVPAVWKVRDEVVNLWTAAKMPAGPVQNSYTVPQTRESPLRSFLTPKRAAGPAAPPKTIQSVTVRLLKPV
jgi:hypothetical protein